MAGVDLPTYPNAINLVTEPVAPIQGPMVISLHHGFYCQQTPHGSFIMGFGDPNELKEHVAFRPPSILWRRWRPKSCPVLPPLAQPGRCGEWRGYNMSPDAQPIWAKRLRAGDSTTPSASAATVCVGSRHRHADGGIDSARSRISTFSALSLERFGKRRIAAEPSVVKHTK